MTRIVTLIAGAALLVAATACGPLSEADAKKAWGATSKGLNAEPDSSSITAMEAYTGDCAEGGSAAFTSTGDVEAGEITTVNFAYDVVYTDCQEDGIIINGTIVYTGSVITDSGALETEVKETYTGDLSYSGEVNGSCNAAMEGVVTASMTGASVRYSGSYCGYDGETFEDVDVEVVY